MPSINVRHYRLQPLDFGVYGGSR